MDAARSAVKNANCEHATEHMLVSRGFRSTGSIAVFRSHIRLAAAPMAARTPMHCRKSLSAAEGGVTDAVICAYGA